MVTVAFEEGMTPSGQATLGARGTSFSKERPFEATERKPCGWVTRPSVQAKPCGWGRQPCGWGRRPCGWVMTSVRETPCETVSCA